VGPLSPLTPFNPAEPVIPFDKPFEIEPSVLTYKTFAVFRVVNWVNLTSELSTRKEPLKTTLSELPVKDIYNI
jgi:hypothetical protein